jgi:hypothetical protein
MMLNWLANKSHCQTSSKMFIQIDDEEAKKFPKRESDRPIWKKYFQSSWTKDTINAGIDEEVFATSEK